VLVLVLVLVLVFVLVLALVLVLARGCPPNPYHATSDGTADALYVQNNALTGDWPEEFCADNGTGTVTDSAIDNNTDNTNRAKSTVVDDFGLDCDQVECSCCGIMQCYY